MKLHDIDLLLTLNGGNIFYCGKNESKVRIIAALVLELLLFIQRKTYALCSKKPVNQLSVHEIV